MIDPQLLDQHRPLPSPTSSARTLYVSGSRGELDQPSADSPSAAYARLDGPLPMSDAARSYTQERQRYHDMQQQQHQQLQSTSTRQPSSGAAHRPDATPTAGSSSANRRSAQESASASASSASTSNSPSSRTSGSGYSAPIHRVYVLNCATCDLFLSDRGMRAVLLLKPNIVLFSTDASPLNAGPVWPLGTDDPTAERTCDCLTSSLACHGCGSTIGYHIVQPCARCSASVAKHQRSANHHRYVFHHNEVSARERRYFASEPGVVNLGVPASRVGSPAPSRGSSPAPPSPIATEVNKDAPANNMRFAPSSPPQGGLSPAHALSPRSASVQPVDRHGRNMGLRPGDVVYWHNLVSGGEKAEPIDPATRPFVAKEIAGR
ncbi:BZ3500_MvSof-1268-A1-R1_Chr1-1g00924 [Microbotryum saponariae]|uniref:BZ3500_MvSof-1268-A1-R1_Chr1-1g00924 protein n=1 Tax=Microbotryum saponariae TaxID=289078 RepID=A0A2X0KM63_9BASI|nr:BZ3500_MvSof-1268-A1-R1_Chr1-1g00924 [Microbotryum saponariae]SCZ92948.1 BZ3501_MvSof-1269-A2-R1_Chr1-1g00521 [Microbotryum saponariae]